MHTRHVVQFGRANEEREWGMVSIFGIKLPTIRESITVRTAQYSFTPVF